MTDSCPNDGRHDGWAPVDITMVGVSPQPPFVHYRRFQLCAHDDHPDNFERCYPTHDDCGQERGLAVLWIRCINRRTRLVTPYQRLCQRHVKRIADAVRWVCELPPHPNDPHRHDA